jgi:hypothetical protein
VTSKKGPLVVRRQRSRPRRRTVLWAIVAIIALLAAFGGIAALALAQSTAAPAASISPAPSDSPSAAPTDEPAASGGQSLTDVVDGQTVRLELPQAEPVGIAVLFPGLAEDPSAALTTPWAQGLADAGWALATSDFHGASWGSPSSSADLQALLTWTSTQTDAGALLFVSNGMGATTSITAMARQPASPVACWYSAAPIVDLVSLAETDPTVQDQIRQAWGRLPGTDEAPLAVVETLPTDTAYRVLAPPAGAPEALVQNSDILISSLESSGHAVTTATLTATPDAAVAIDPAELLGYAEVCDA